VPVDELCNTDRGRTGSGVVSAEATSASDQASASCNATRQALCRGDCGGFTSRIERTPNTRQGILRGVERQARAAAWPHAGFVIAVGVS
jgi:hypothetical protein